MILTTDELWALTAASSPCGLMPSAKSVMEFAESLVTKGWLRQSDHHPFYYITDKGKQVLAEAKDQTMTREHLLEMALKVAIDVINKQVPGMTSPARLALYAIVDNKQTDQDIALIKILSEEQHSV